MTQNLNQDEPAWQKERRDAWVKFAAAALAAPVVEERARISVRVTWADKMLEEFDKRFTPKE